MQQFTKCIADVDSWMRSSRLSYDEPRHKWSDDSRLPLLSVVRIGSSQELVLKGPEDRGAELETPKASRRGDGNGEEVSPSPAD